MPRLPEVVWGMRNAGPIGPAAAPFLKSDMKRWKRTFLLIWAGQAASVLTSSVVGYAVIFWMSLETGSAEVLAMAAIAGMLPQSVIGLFAGAFVDRWNRKRTMILSDAFIALCTLALALLFGCGRAELWQVYALLACRSAGSAFHRPAMTASVPLLAPQSELTRIAGVNQMISAASDIAGPALGALLLAVWSVEGVLLLDVAGAAAACLSLALVRIPDPDRRSERTGLPGELREGFAAVWAVPGLPWLFALTLLVWFFVMPVGVLFPLMTLDRFGGGAFEMSLVEIVWGGGALAGGAAMGLRRFRGNRVALIVMMYLLVGVSFLLSGLLPPSGFAWFAALTAAGGISSSVFNASFTAVVQSRIDAGVLGRVMSLYYTFALLPSAVGLLGAGFLAEVVGLPRTFVLAGTVICAVALAGCCIPSLRRLDARHP